MINHPAMLTQEEQNASIAAGHSCEPMCVAERVVQAQAVKVVKWLAEHNRGVVLIHHDHGVVTYYQPNLILDSQDWQSLQKAVGKEYK